MESLSFILIVIPNRGLDKRQSVLLTHGDSIDRVGNGFVVIGNSGSAIIGISNETLQIYGVQFHPEVDLTVEGKAMLKNFLFDISGLAQSYTLRSRETQCIEYIREAVKNHKVLVCLTLPNYTYLRKAVWRSICDKFQ